MTKYYVKAPVTGWHEVNKEGYEKYIEFLRENAQPTIPMDELIQSRTRIEIDTTPGGAV